MDNRIKEQVEFNDEYNPTGCFWIIIWFFIMMIVIAITITCENEKSDCWECEIRTTWKFPGQNPYQVSQTNKYLFCDYDDEYIERFKQCNTWSDSLTTQSANCRREIK